MISTPINRFITVEVQINMHTNLVDRILPEELNFEIGFNFKSFAIILPSANCTNCQNSVKQL